MVNPGSFTGARKDFLIGEKDTYKQAVEGGYVADAVADIQRRYFKRFPTSLPHNEEPTADFLASVDDDAPEPEVLEPDEALLGKQEYELAMAALQTRRKLVTFRKGQIKRWLVYQHMKDQDFDPKEPNAKNPYRVMLHQLTGVSITRPRLRTAVNTWRKTQRDAIEVEVRRRVAAGGLARKDIAALRDKVARDMFSQLSQEERDRWGQRAKTEHETLLAQWKQDIEGKPSTSPASRQRCIQGLVRFMQPILDNVCEATGWKASLIAGGPEPANGGRLNVVSIHSGTAPGDVEMNFGRSEQIPYKRYIVPSYGRFLQKCFPVEECRSRALPEDDEGEFKALAAMGLENEGVNIDTVNDARTSVALPALPDPQSASSHSETAPPPRSLPPSTDTSAVRTLSAALPPSELPQPPPSPSIGPRASRIPSPAPSPNPSRAPSPRQSPNSRRSSGPTTVSCASSTTRDSDKSLESAQNDAFPLLRQHGDTHSPDADAHVPGDSPTSPSPEAASPSNQPTEDADKAQASEDAIPSPRHASKRVRHEPPAESPAKRLRSAGSVTGGATLSAAAGTRSRSRVLSAQPVARSQRKRGTAKPVTTPSSTSTRSNSADHPASAPRTASPTQPNTAPPPTDDNGPTPKWFQSALSMFEQGSLGDEWRELVAVWSAFEKQHKYTEMGKLESTHRPAIVGEWIKRARSVTFRPTINNISDFEEDLRMWWTSLQPEWRVSDGLLLLERIDGDWEVLRKPGQNGILSVLAALFYWGKHITEKDDELDMWINILRDCKIALSHLLYTHTH